MSINIFLLSIIVSCSLLFSSDFYYTKGEKVFLKKNNSRSTKISYMGENNTSLESSGDIIINFKDVSIKEKIIKKYNLKELKHLYANIYVFNTQDLSKTLSIANTIYEKEDVIFSHPNFSIRPRKRTLDPLYKSSWHLNSKKDYVHIDIEEAFKFTKGANTKVGMYDDGLDIWHEDLVENIKFAKKNDLRQSADFDFIRTHGTQLAGLVAASENDKGSVGVSPASKLYFVEYDNNVNYIDAYTVFSNLDKLKVPIIVNAWGTYQATDYFYNFIRKLATEGRDGKGMIIIFAAGNDSHDYDIDHSLRDESESEYVISVSAANGDGKFASLYSNQGKSIDIAAPGGDFKNRIVTTNILSTYGEVIGTSASAAIVGSVVALALDINPDLTRKEILDMLNQTSLKNGDIPYINGKNKELGYGLINAGNMVKSSILSYEKYLSNKTFPILGTFINVGSNFLYKDNNNIFFELDSNNANKQNPYGFTQTNKTTTNKSSIYLIKIRNIQNNELNIQDLALVDSSSSKIYKLTKLEKGFVEYAFPLKLNSTISRSQNNKSRNIYFQ